MCVCVFVEFLKNLNQEQCSASLVVKGQCLCQGFYGSSQLLIKPWKRKHLKVNLYLLHIGTLLLLLLFLVKHV